jgi:hypothetical protein
MKGVVFTAAREAVVKERVPSEALQHCLSNAGRAIEAITAAE